jgi:tetratricopeptide (TPR) repeat protein
LNLLSGKVEGAEETLLYALQLFPDYHYALGNLAQVRAAQGRYAEAVDLLRQRFELAPHPENLFELARALERAGRSEEARRAYAEFEGKARAESEKSDNCNRELIFYYVDHARTPDKALAIAHWQMRWRRDVYTLDAYAWALDANGEHAEARAQIEKALAVGIRDATFFYHAGAIAQAGGDREAALRYLHASLEVNPRSASAPAARAALDRLCGDEEADCRQPVPSRFQEPLAER